MERMDGSEPTGLADVIASLEALKEAKQVQVDAARAVFDGRMAELKQINAMLRTARPQPRLETKARAKPNRLGEEELRIMLRRIDDLPPVVDDIPGSFTTRSVADGLGMDKSKVERAINYMRDSGTIRMVGERRTSGSRLSRIFVVDSGETGE
jgi:hypothetical protein